MEGLHEDAWRPAGDAIQVGPPGINEPPASEFEPVARIAVDATGISLRRGDRATSDISFDGLRKVCHLYESRCSGHYSAKTLAGRFLYQLSQEVQTIASAVERRYQRRAKRVAYLEAIVKEWESVFGAYSETDGAVIAGISGYALTPRALHDALRERDGRLAALEATLTEMRAQHKSDLARFEKVVDEQFRASRARYRGESSRLRAEAEETRREATAALQAGLDEARAELQRRMQECIRLCEEEKRSSAASLTARVRELTESLASQRREAAAAAAAAERAKALAASRLESAVSEAVEAARAQAEEEMKGQAEHYTRVLAKQSAEHDKRMSEALSGAGVTTSGGARLTRAQADRALAENEYLRSRAEDLQRMVDALQAAMASGTNVEEARAVRARNEERRRKKDAKRRQKRGGGLGKEKEKGNKKKVQPSSSSSGIPRLVPRTAGARDVAL